MAPQSSPSERVVEVSANFNELSDDQTERLACLAEECSEVIQIVGKILRHGYDSTHPDDPDGDDNRAMLAKEVGHVLAVLAMMDVDLSTSEVAKSRRKKLNAIRAYLHHQ